MKRLCRSCGREKLLDQFHKNGKYFRRDCRECYNARMRLVYFQRQAFRQLSLFRTCSSCHRELLIHEFKRIETCKDCFHQDLRRERQENPDLFRRREQRSYQRHRHRVIQRKLRQVHWRNAMMANSCGDRSVGTEEVIEAYGSICYLCGLHLQRNQVTIDHVIPFIRGGDHTLDNVRPCCKSCNSRKGGRLLSELDLDSFRSNVQSP